MNNLGVFNISEADEREQIIKLIDKEEFEKNLSYQVILNKFSLTPYIYELENVDPFFEDYKKSAKSKINSFVLHPFQLQILNELKNGNNIIVSAPTSFGKTASIFEYLYERRAFLKKILIIVPTIALRNEYLEKINDCLDNHKIITNSLDLSYHNSFCLILTHEKFVEYFSKNKTSDLSIDLLVIDEIYKLQNENDSERMYSMSLAYLTAIKISKQYIFLGPFINSINLPDVSDYKMLKYEYSPIATEMIYEADHTISNLKNNINNSEKTLVYFSNKNDIIKTIDNLILTSDAKLKNKDLLEYIEVEYDKEWTSEWSVLKALKNGIGIHYNELPSFIKEYVLDSYNTSNEIMLLLATSTLLEGVNTSTKNLIITSDKIGTSRLSDFEFWNLAGRAGRLGKYKVGKVTYYGNKEDFKKENKYIDLNNFWINDEQNIDEYEIINNGVLSNKDKQAKVEMILLKYNLSIDDIKFMLLPFFSKIDKIIEFFDGIYPSILKAIKELLVESLNNEKKKNSRNIRKIIFEEYLKLYKPTINNGALPYDHFSILSNAISMAHKTKTQKIKEVVKCGREILNSHKDEPEESKKIKMNNLYNYSFYMVNNYIENSYIPAINILKMLFEKNNPFSSEEMNILNNCIFKQADAFSTMTANDEIFETLGIISPLAMIIKSQIGNEKISNISDLKEKIAENIEVIKDEINGNKLYSHYLDILLKKLKL